VPIKRRDQFGTASEGNKTGEKGKGRRFKIVEVPDKPPATI
jgi:hypothetical protein